MNNADLAHASPQGVATHGAEYVGLSSTADALHLLSLRALGQVLWHVYVRMRNLRVMQDAR